MIDWGWGPEISSETLASTIMKPSSTLYWIDNTDSSVDEFDSRFKESDFIKNQDNHFKRIDSKAVKSRETIDSLENEAVLGLSGRRVFSLTSDIDQLPFPDQTFDAYTSNLLFTSKSLVRLNYLNMLVESYRTLKDNWKAAFAVWGREENWSFITLLPSILEKHNIEVDPEIYSWFDLIDSEQVKEDAKELGFRSVKNFYYNVKLPIPNGAEMWRLLLSSKSKKYLQKLGDEMLEKVKLSLIQEFDDKFGEKKHAMIGFEIEIIVCTK
jgi:ubiquinone/menaquinone biosynthesis C-methylase UbiE